MLIIYFHTSTWVNVVTPFHICCPESLVLPECFGVSPAFVVHSMNSTKDQRVSSPLTSELVVDERERLQHGQERERARHDSETAEQRNS